MTIHRFGTIAAAGLIALQVLAGTANAQTEPGSKSPQKTPTPTPTVEPRPERSSRYEGFYRGPIVRLFQNYLLPAGDTTREVYAVLADVRIDGTVWSDVSVTVGNATLGPKAVIEGDLIVVGGSATVEAGAKVGRGVVVIGGTLVAPENWVAGGQHVVVGTPVIGEFLRGLTPWLTRGLLLGRLIVPGLGWVWIVVGVSFLIGLILNQMFARQVGACASTLERRPGGTFFVGLLVLLLVGPAMAIVAVTVIGLPFAFVALVAAFVIGKLGVTRVIGRGIVHEGDPGNRGVALRSYVIGAAVITFAYMVPVLGLMTWALIGVFGLGTATMTFMASLRRERPAPPPAAPAEPPTTPVDPNVGRPFMADELAGAKAPAYVEVAPPPAFVPPPPPPAPVAAVEVTPPVVYPDGDLRGYPRAAFLDRMAAFAIDAILIAIVYGVVVDGILFVRLNDGGAYPAMLIGYHIAFWAWKGTTLGGIICNLRMVRTTGEDPRFIDALVRGLTAILSVVALGIGCFWMINDPERQMWHDKIAGTVVVKVPREKVLR